MVTLRDVVIFLAGASAFHTLSHLILPVMVTMPLQVKCPRMTFTQRWNTVVIVINAAVTFALLVWADSL